MSIMLVTLTLSVHLIFGVIPQATKKDDITIAMHVHIVLLLSYLIFTRSFPKAK